MLLKGKWGRSDERKELWLVIADTGLAVDSVCPKGWRLPINGGIDTDKSYGKLVYVYTGATGDGADTKTDPVRAAEIERQINKLLAAPTEFVYSDYYDYGGALNSRPFGSYWSASVYSATYSRNLRFNTDGTTRNLYPQDRNVKGYAFAVRCVGGGSICPTNWNLPDFTDQVGVKDGTAPSYNNLTAAYEIVHDTKAGVDDILAIPLSFPRSGYFHDGYLDARSDSSSGGGGYWPSRTTDGKRAYFFNFYRTASIGRYDYPRSNGRSVRCVVGITGGFIKSWVVRKNGS